MQQNKEGDRQRDDKDAQRKGSASETGSLSEPWKRDNRAG